MNKEKFQNIYLILDDTNYMRHSQLQKALNKNSEKHDVENHRTNRDVFHRCNSRIKNSFSGHIFYNKDGEIEIVYKHTKTVVKNKASINKTIII